MGFYVCKRINAGPFEFNLSRSGPDAYTIPLDATGATCI